ncbi:MAG: bifunctional nuclease family protein [Anaerolineales bacterium]
MPRMIEVVIDSVRVSLTNQQRIVVLRELNAERYLPIWIGPYEAEAITISLQEVEVARPQTHDLLKNVIHALNARLVRVEIIALRDDVFYGNLVLEVNGQTLDVDSRPSDALALAVRFHVPVYVAQDVLDVAGIVPERDIAEQPQQQPLVPPPPEPVEELPEESEDRLSIFEDFLQNLNLDEDNPDKKEGDSDTDKDKPDPPK